MHRAFAIAGLALFILSGEGLSSGAPARVTLPAGDRAAGAPGREAAGGEAASPPVIVMIADRRQTTASRELKRAVVAQLSDTPVRLRIHWVDRFGSNLRLQLQAARRAAAGRKAVAVFWFDLSGSEDIYLFLAEPGRGRLLVRSVDRPGEARAEAVAIIVAASVRALLQGGGLGLTRPPSPGSAPPRPPRAAAPPRGPAPRPRESPEREPSSIRELPDGALAVRLERARWTWLSLELAYAVGAYNRDNGPRHGVQIGLTLHATAHWSVFVAYRLTQSLSAEALVGERYEENRITASLQRYPVTLGGRLGWRFGRVHLGAALGLVFDYVTAAASVSQGSMESPEDRGDWHLLASVEGRVAYRPLEGLAVWMGVGFEVPIWSRHYSVAVPVSGEVTESITLMAPWPVQPICRIGLEIHVF